MTILRLAYEWPPTPASPLPAGGGGWDGLNPGIYELTRAQTRLGDRLLVFCGGGELSWETVLHPNPTFEEGIAIYRFPRAIRRFSLFLTTAPAVLWGYLKLRYEGEKIDVVHGHGHVTFWFNLYKFLFGFLDKTPHVLHLHITAAGREREALNREATLDPWTRYFEWPLHKFSDWLGVRVADHIFCTSESVASEVELYYGIGSDKVTVLENGVDASRFTSEGGNLRANFGWESAVVIYYNGFLSERKNADLLVYALKLLPENFRLLITGRGQAEYENYLKKLISEKGLGRQVRFEGYIEYKNLPPYYRTADIFVLPSSYEGLPKVILEALASGVPVIASGFNMKQKVRGLHFLVSPDHEELADEIRRVVGLSEDVDVDLIRRRYDWAVIATEIKKIYEKL